MSGRQDFWSRRKAAVAAEERAETQAEARAEGIRQAVEEKPDSEVLAELNLPDPDAMRQGDDFSAFMAKAVPERLRRRALRRLWTSNPVLANLDELLEYGEDYTDAATVVENLQTVYKLGKGMLAQFEGRPETGAAQPDAGTTDAAEPAGAAENEEAQDREPASGTPEDGAAETVEAETVEAETAVEAVPRSRRRMRFAFADDSDRRENA